MKSFQNIIYCNEHITILFSLYPPHIFLIQHKFFAENILHLIKFRNFSLEKHSGNYIKYHKMILFVTIFIFYVTKLLQKSEMRKDIVIELSYKGFS